MNRSTFLPAFVLVLSAPVAMAQQQYGRDSDTWRWDGRVENGRC